MSKKVNEVAIFARIGYEMFSTNDKDGNPWRWRHVVYSGYNQAFRSFFPDKDPVEAMNRLVGEGLITLSLAKGGATFVLNEVLTQPLSAAEERFAKKAREHIAAFLQERKEARTRKQKKAEPSPLAIEAAQLIEAGDIAGAMKLLGH